MSKTVNGEYLFDDVAKEVFRRLSRRVADFCGVQVLTHEILSNHFHLLVRVPHLKAVSDQELLRRYRVLHPKATARQNAMLDVIAADLATNGPAGQAWRRQQLAQMGDISTFMKLLKLSFSIWFNKSRGRFGTLWAERFKSVLVESGQALQTMAAYIELNCVRAGIVTDPKNYRFCGYAEAVAGNVPAQEGICHLMEVPSWKKAQEEYRQLLFGAATVPRKGAATVTVADFQRIVEQGGTLHLADVLRCRVRYFTDGAILGSKAFVEFHLARYREKGLPCDRTRPRPLPECTSWGELTTLRALRKPAIG